MPSHAFFPAVSWLGWPIWKLTGSDLLAVHLVASVTGIAAFIAVWGVSKAWRDEVVARRAVLLFALFPSSLFLWAFYSEGIFIALGAGAVWADRRGKRGLAAALLVGIGATRSVGILIPAVIILARIISQRRVDKWCVDLRRGGRGRASSRVLAVMHAQVGDAFAWMKVQKDWGRSPSAPWTTIEQGFHNLWPAKGTVMVPALVARNLDLWCVLIVVLGLGYAAFSRRDRFPMETWMLGVAMIILPLCSSVLASFNRFVFADWVLFPVYASAIGRLPKPWRDRLDVGHRGGVRPHVLRPDRPLQHRSLRRLTATARFMSPRSTGRVESGDGTRRWHGSSGGLAGEGVEADVGLVEGAVVAAQLVEAGLDLGLERGVVLGRHGDLEALVALAAQPAEQAVAVERPALGHGAHVAARRPGRW